MAAGLITHVIIDFGGVISYPQPESDVAAILAAVGGDPAQARARFWRHRLDYDRGDLADHEYWSLVTGRPLAAAGPEVLDLVTLDVRSWSRVRPESLRAIDGFAELGLPLALLSNTPAPHAAWMLAQPWAERFGVHVFSYRVRVAKPDTAIFEHTLDRLGCRPDQAVFVDDREDNCDGARAVGVTAVRFDGPAEWDQVRSLVG